ncbi:type II secretion system F family protein [Thauera butanivorans]|uniref:type II secretion system F family protein n=1 Tax=Thauera butanivorans TaxID=86174 RepID=UPI0008389BF5|nr:type II secretion system F family protein [Thauera butanivorans]
MPDFIYRAAERDGRTSEGRIAADGREHAMRQLRAKGLTPLTLEPATGEAGGPAAGLPDLAVKNSRRKVLRLGGNRPPSQADVHDMTSELAVMLRAGLPLDRALRVLIGMSGSPAMERLLDDVFKAVKGGKSLSQALAPHRELFGDFYLSMIRSGEIGGQLPDVLGRLAEHLERVKGLRDSVVSALIYPAILVVVACISVFLMLGFVVPQFESLFNDMGEALPLPTRIIVGAGHFVADWWWLIALMVFLAAVAVRKWVATPAGRATRDAWLLRLPVLGQVLRKYEITRFARSMGTLLGNGVPIVGALNIAAETMGNKQLRVAMDCVAPVIKQGGRMAEALERTKLFTPLALNMVRLGEETGRLDAMLQELARVSDAEVQNGVKRALTLLEPALILILGGMIAAIIVAILMGILSVNDLAV